MATNTAAIVTGMALHSKTQNMLATVQNVADQDWRKRKKNERPISNSSRHL